MARKGPAPRPAKLKMLDGTYRADRDGPLGPEPAAGEPPMPDWLPDRAKAEWRRLAPKLLALGLLSELDLAALTAYCVAVSELEAATRTLEKDGRLVAVPVVTKSGETVGARLRPHPAVAMQRSAAALVRGFQAEFGLSPSGRTRVKASPPAAGAGVPTAPRFFPEDARYPSVRSRPPTTLDRQGKPG